MIAKIALLLNVNFKFYIHLGWLSHGIHINKYYTHTQASMSQTEIRASLIFQIKYE